jgi:hypothetical protein
MVLAEDCGGNGVDGGEEVVWLAGIQAVAERGWCPGDFGVQGRAGELPAVLFWAVFRVAYRPRRQSKWPLPKVNSLPSFRMVALRNVQGQTERNRGDRPDDSADDCEQDPEAVGQALFSPDKNSQRTVTGFENLECRFGGAVERIACRRGNGSRRH